MCRDSGRRHADRGGATRQDGGKRAAPLRTVVARGFPDGRPLRSWRARVVYGQSDLLQSRNLIAQRLRPRLQHEIERRLRGATKTAEAAAVDNDITQSRFAGLRTERRAIAGQ